MGRFDINYYRYIICAPRKYKRFVHFTIGEISSQIKSGYFTTGQRCWTKTQQSCLRVPETIIVFVQNLGICMYVCMFVCYKPPLPKGGLTQFINDPFYIPYLSTQKSLNQYDSLYFPRIFGTPNSVYLSAHNSTIELYIKYVYQQPWMSTTLYFLYD